MMLTVAFWRSFRAVECRIRKRLRRVTQAIKNQNFYFGLTYERIVIDMQTECMIKFI